MNLSLILALSAFVLPSPADVSKMEDIDLGKITRFGMDDVFADTPEIDISADYGPKTDGKTDFVNVIALDPATLGKGEIAAYVVRLEKVDGDITMGNAPKNIGAAAKQFLTKVHEGREFATSAVNDLPAGKDLHNNWQTVLVIEYKNGTWIAIDLGQTSVEFSTDGHFAVQLGFHMARFGKDDIYGLLCQKLTDIARVLDRGHSLGDTMDKSWYLVRAPINSPANVAFAVINATNKIQWLFDADYKVVSFSKMVDLGDGTLITALPAIGAKSQRLTGSVTTVSSTGDDYDTRIDKPAAQQLSGDRKFVRAYEAAA